MVIVLQRERQQFPGVQRLLIGRGSFLYVFIVIWPGDATILMILAVVVVVVAMVKIRLLTLSLLALLEPLLS